MKITDDHEVTEMEQITRFACGGFVGFLFGLLLHVLSRPDSVIGTALLFMVCVGVPGLLALIHGDRFWYKLGDLLGLL